MRMLAATFDAFLESGCPSTHDAWNIHDAKALSPLDIRYWRGGRAGLDLTNAELEDKVLQRRTNLWRMVLSQEGRMDSSAFTIRAIPRSFFSRYVFEPLNFLRLLTQGSRLLPSILRPGETPPDFFAVSRHILYTLQPREHSPWTLPLQQVHISPFAIPPDVADISCDTLNVTELLSQLNGIFGTQVSSEPSLAAYLTQCIEEKWDLGKVYGCLRPWWLSTLPFSEILARMHLREQQDFWLRRDAENIPRSTITTPHVPPRRVWDLYSNRTLPFYALRDEHIQDNVWAVSHSWVAESKRHRVRTNINGGEWLVPLPKDTSLDHIRIELLNMGAEYVFLDVLCLRQQSYGYSEDLREYEWRLDVSTLGFIYRHNPFQTVIIYFNGLGMPFDIGTNVLDSPLHWFNRTWTLQEAAINWLPGGLCTNSLRESPDGLCFTARMREALGVVLIKEPNLREILKAMKRRPGFADKKPFDRVAALAYLLPNSTRPAYTETWGQAEEAWDALFATFSSGDLFEFLVRYPFSRSAWDWRPSWAQMVLSLKLAPEPSLPCAADDLLVPITRCQWESSSKLNGLFYNVAYVVSRCLVTREGWLTVMPREKSGLENTDSDYRVDEHSDKLFTIRDDAPSGTINSVHKPFAFESYAPLPPNVKLALVGVADLECWIVGTIEELTAIPASRGPAIPAIMLRKFTVGRMNDPGDRERLRQLGVGYKQAVVYMSKKSSH